MNESVIKTISSEMNRYLNNYQMSKLNEVLYKRLDLDEEEISNEEYLNKFINSKRLEGCSNLTLKNYTIHVSKLFNYLNKDIRTMDTEDLRNYLSYYQSKNNCNSLTIDGVRRSLSSFFTFLEVEDYIVKSPVRRIHKIKTDILVKETYSDEVLEKLRNNCSNIRNLAIIDLLASSGVRISELVNLNIEDINFEEKSCVVFGKGKKMREVYFDGKTKLHLQEYLNSRRDSNNALFVSLYKPYEKLKSRGIELMLQRLGEKNGISKVHPHKFRRTLATRAIDKGMPIEQVQHLLGHTKIETTLLYAMVNQNNVKNSHRKYIS
ncbi:MAG: site-specific tyrosine recombinase/integron integrase [Clostridia bacterium]|nr:site-specific tyrosine recombinase/integron integrase [Clostridia bacterium]